MKTMKSLLPALLVLFLAGTSVPAWAMGRARTRAPAPGASPSPSPSVSPSPAALDVTPDALRQNLLSGNNDILVSLNQIYQAKDQRTEAMTNLLPSANLGAIFGTTSSGPSFLLSSVQFLLPFLLPSNWIDLRQQDHLLDAQIAAYKILELDQYASAYTLYETVVNDLDAKAVLQENYDTLYKIYQTLALEAEQVGTENPTDALQAKERADAALVPLTDMQKVIDIDTAALRQAMGLSEEVRLSFDHPVHVPASALEDGDVNEVLQQALAVAPEKAQLAALLAAAKDAKWSSIFGFVGKNTLGTLPMSQGSGNQSISLSDMVDQGQISIGFSYVPSIRLTQDNIDAIQLQQRDLGLQEANIVETVLASVKSSKEELTDAKNAEDEAYQFFLTELQNYDMGSVDLLQVLQAESDYTNAAGARVQSQAALDGARITLERALLTGEFAPDRIKGCAPSPKTSVPTGFWHWIRSIFHPGADHVTLEEMCKVAQAATPMPESSAGPVRP